MLRNLNSAPAAGLRILGTPKTGVLGSSIPASGQNASSFLYQTLSLPADATREIRGWIVSRPSSGLLTSYENGSYEFDSLGVDGTYEFTYQLYVDGAVVGPTATVTLEVGSASVHGSMTLGASTLSGSTQNIAKKLRQLNYVVGDRRYLATNLYWALGSELYGSMTLGGSELVGTAAVVAEQATISGSITLTDDVLLGTADSGGSLEAALVYGSMALLPDYMQGFVSEGVVQAHLSGDITLVDAYMRSTEVIGTFDYPPAEYVRQGVRYGVAGELVGTMEPLAGKSLISFGFIGFGLTDDGKVVVGLH